MSSLGASDTEIGSGSRPPRSLPAEDTRAGLVRSGRMSSHDDHHGELDYEEDEDIMEQITRGSGQSIPFFFSLLMKFISSSLPSCLSSQVMWMKKKLATKRNWMVEDHRLMENWMT